MTTIQHDQARHRFTATVDGHDAGLDYQLDDGCMVITHTGVPQPVEGRGIASDLVQAAFEHARDQRLSVRPQCAYAAGWVERHPEFNQQLA